LFNHQYRSKFKIGVRLGISIRSICLWALVLAAFALSGQRALHDTLRRYDSDLMPSLRIIHTIVEGVDTTRRHEPSI
jgi:hypothetical protein